jgi:phage-related protein
VEYEVILLEEAEGFLSTLPKKLYGKTLFVISLLGQFGPYLSMPHSRKLKGHDLWELRVQQGSDICRLFYFYSGDHVYILTSGYRKKTQRTSVREIERARRIRDDFIAGREK